MNNNETDIFHELIARDWTTNGDENEGGLVRYDELPKYETFIRECFLKNRVAVFTAKCGLTDQWACRAEWLNESGTMPDFDRLITLYGHMTVPVTRCSPSTTTEYASDENKLTMSFEEFVQLWRNNDTTMNAYCKDWHLQMMIDENTPLFYSVPFYFQSDWLNETCLADKRDDFRFVYMGGHGTNTPLHMDVLGTYSWSANICGRKHWHFSKPFSFEFVQEPGDVIFVPSEWYHDVTNIGHTISINHNWFNAFNILRIWKHLCSVLQDIEHRIEDCRSMMTDTWYEHCQLILMANEGMNFSSLYTLLHKIAQRRIDGHQREHARFDLWMIDKLLRQMIQTSTFLYACDFDTLPVRPKVLLSQIHSYLLKEQKSNQVDG